MTFITAGAMPRGRLSSVSTRPRVPSHHMERATLPQKAVTTCGDEDQLATMVETGSGREDRANGRV